MSETWKNWEGRVVNEEFRLIRYLGGSDHSAVYLTERGEQAGQKAAIKLIPANAQNPELQLSWWELSAKLSHPHLARLLQVGHCEMDGTEFHYALMEYADDNLAQILPLRALTSGEALEALTAVLDALTYIHTKSFVHGHIKPSNVMAVSDQIKISSDTLCGVGESSRVMGKPDIYTAPEIAGGGGMSPAADVWSLGMTLVEALTQQLPSWEGAEQGKPVVPGTLPAPFLEIANHCLLLEPARRWTVGQISAKLRQSPTTPVEKEKEKVQQPVATSKWRSAAAAGVIVLVAILAISRMRDRHPKRETVPPVANESAQPQAEAPLENPNIRKEGQAASVSARPAASRSTTKAATSTADSTPGEVVHQVVPDVSRSARNTIQGRIRVTLKASVDSSGNVVATKFMTRGASKYFARLAQQSAQRWTFLPPQAGGRPVASQWTLRFEFSRAATNAHSTQVSP